ncbi:hypothetical protein CRG98_017828 [Punica granatum]|uniref:Uncharacterized protein n=1 Tax=Punica granatum TaxID=22663 RepID=A0A2I0JZN7_PUNGR|nr:hypothetical protein CRG98_017828 [Punica granatum]
MARGSQEGLSATSLGIRIGEVRSAGRPDWLSGFLGLYRLIGVAFLCEEAPGGLLMQGRWLLTPKRSSEVAVVVVLIDPTGQVRKKRLFRRLPVVFCCKIFLEDAKKIGKNWKNLRREKGVKRQWCTVERLSARDHLVMGECEGHEEFLESDGTTRLSRGMEWHV